MGTAEEAASSGQGQSTVVHPARCTPTLVVLQAGIQEEPTFSGHLFLCTWVNFICYLSGTWGRGLGVPLSVVFYEFSI